MRMQRMLCLVALFTLIWVPTFAKETTTQKSSVNELSAKSNTPTKTIKDPQSKDKIKNYHVYDDIDMISNINIIYDRPRVVIKSVTPILHSDVGDTSNVQFFNDAVTEVVNNEIDKFKERVKANEPAFAHLKKYTNKLNIDFDTSAIDSGESHVISIRFNVQGLIAGTSQAYHYHRSFNYDLDENKVIEMSDLFAPDKNYLSVLSYLSNAYLSRQLEDKSLVSQGTSPIPENFKNWNIKPYGLLITFDEAQVAPAGRGAQTVLIPYPALAGLIPNNSPIAGCLKNHKRCIRNKLLTGGFIDEV